MKDCAQKGVFYTALRIDKQPMIDCIPQEAIRHHKPQGKKGRQTVRYSPAEKSHETSELLQLAGELHNHRALDELHQFFRAGNLK